VYQFSTSHNQVMDLLLANDFPLQELCAYPISAIEGISTELSGTYKSVCPIDCLACCADSIRPVNAINNINVLTPAFFSQILVFLEKFITNGFDVLSLERLTLFSDSNELNHPYCFELRELLSSFLCKHYGFPLGFISSDISFHISNAKIFSYNLLKIVDRPYLWDNICFSIDEQIPIENKEDYERYLETLSCVWKVLMPVIKGEILHSNIARKFEPRLIINFLIPDFGSKYKDAYKTIYPGGPERATTYDELIDRYVEPFVGKIKNTSTCIPSNHLFTTEISKLTNVPSSTVFISKSKYSGTGRAKNFIDQSATVFTDYNSSPVIRTKIYPSKASQFIIQASFAPTLSSEDTIILNKENTPQWFNKLHQFSFISDKV